MTEDRGTISPTRRGRIVVGVDGSAGSIDALGRSARLAALLDTDLEVVTSWSYPSGYGMAAIGEWNPEADAKAAQTTALEAVFPDVEPAGLVRTVREGHPARVLLAASADAEMLVVGSRGHGGFAGLLLGSVSTHCAEHATCPVLVAHTRT